ncbi:K+-transporting ATPase [Acididesulfobacillus acetoxydans]|uniref:Potassium-transporting ATPase KdpC subunit n=1 Tax=Acididesulfobacillus acetoxydans TaxID=1561005 RepID=A0A8S0VXW0_9FIRM|nr:potassium-transporting ATPase subunit KdpC [Acididesulfobacillus acetoxydans]CAA7602363.1 K+-transporting ATPase [Acididesulfobacillus acetoxydans]CEJ08402.1 Potassium-transporting ATPase C chain [Acididesulfobacillus acetoxydans]
MLRTAGRAFVLLLIMTLITGIAYPLVVTGLDQLIFPHQANGSLLYKDGKPVGSALIGQDFTAPGYFHGRPSAAGKTGYDATSSGGSNLGPTNKTLLAEAGQRAAEVRRENGLAANAPVPSDLITASASGLDPDITPAAARIQVARVAKARNLSVAKVQTLVNRYTERRQFGFLGEPRVNVLRLNLALDALTGR